MVSHLRSNRQRLTAHRVEPEPVLERRRRLLLLRVAGDQRGVHIDHQTRLGPTLADTPPALRPASPRSNHARSRAAARLPATAVAKRSP